MCHRKQTASPLRSEQSHSITVSWLAEEEPTSRKFVKIQVQGLYSQHQVMKTRNWLQSSERKKELKLPNKNFWKPLKIWYERVIWLRYQISSLVNYYIFLIEFWEFGDSSRCYLDDNLPYTCHLPACFKIYEIEKKNIDVDQFLKWRENNLIPVNFYSQIGAKHGS